MNITTVTVGMLGNQCYVLWEDGRDDCVVIDPGSEPEKIRSACKGKTIAAILLTHGHFDHIGGVDALRGEKTEVVLHEADAPLLSSPEMNASWMIRQSITARPATRLVQDGDTFTYADIPFRVIHTPGHTPGCVCYQTGRDLFTGDTLFHYGYGRTDLPGGDENALAASLRKIKPIADQCTLYPGH